ncbi:hypothetical protein jhhlp_000343 [Lomentospora prolificans]|uniref:tRNA (guanine(9)-N1)-methyltransferase n=1 Tax=Lomentospora prolificans TaxID=41688 RepID=A0A2N3NKW0_9PEZI|nr:hypothetical protein jhhlp_000343 [Lomentospora prolificans]
METVPIEQSNGAPPIKVETAPPTDLPADPSNKTHTSGQDSSPAAGTTALSKNQQKKLRRQQAWDAQRDERKLRRKEKRQTIRARKRETYAAAVAEARAAGLDPKVVLAQPKTQSISVPISIIIDCSFEDYMVSKELVSLSSQIQRSYSENRAAPYRPHLFISSWGGKIKERFEVGMNATHKYWKGIQFVEGDVVDASKKATELMAGPRAGRAIDMPKPKAGEPALRLEDPNSEPEEVKEENIIYLTSDSPYILERLEPGTSYVIGGIVDKNREKGLCHRLARKRGIRTAKLPIKEYMVMNSRQVLATNHVVEIMLRWLECGDWGTAFLKALPKRKEAKLREGSAARSVEPEESDDGCDEEKGDGNAQAAEIVEEEMADAPAGEDSAKNELKIST